MSSFDILRILIKHYKQEDLDYEKFCDAVFSNHSEQEEYEIFRGIVAKNPNASERHLMDLWKAVTGKERETQKVINKFWAFLREAKRSLDL